MFVPIEEGFQRKSNHSQKESRCQTKRSMSPGAENRSRCALLTLSVLLRPRRDAPSLLLSGSSMKLEARIWFAAPQRRDLRAMKTRPSAPGKINAPPRSTSHASRRRHSAFPYTRPIFFYHQDDRQIRIRKTAECRVISFLAAVWQQNLNS